MAEFYPISREEMEDLLFNSLNFNPEHNPLNMPRAGELVYGRGFKHFDLSLTIRVYSSIAHGGTARAVGSDAIRCCLLYRRPDGEIRAIGKAKRVHRVKGWRKNLTNRIEAMKALVNGIVLCPQCNQPMAKRSGTNGEFYGCTDYPQCTGTRNIT